MAANVFLEFCQIGVFKEPIWTLKRTTTQRNLLNLQQLQTQKIHEPNSSWIELFFSTDEYNFFYFAL